MPGIFTDDAVFFRDRRVAADVQWGKFREGGKLPLVCVAGVFPQIVEFVAQDGDAVFELAEVFVAFHPEVPDLTVVIVVIFESQIFEKECDNRVSLMDDQGIAFVFILG